MIVLIFLTLRFIFWDVIAYYLDAHGVLERSYFDEWTTLVMCSMLMFLPLQISFDLLYRLIYLRGKIRVFTIVSIVVFFANIFGNYIGIYQLNIGALGVIFSTVFCYGLLVITSFLLIFR